MVKGEEEIVDRMRLAATAVPRKFVDEQLFFVPPYAFRGNSAEYPEFRRELADKLAVTLEEIELVGSGRLGFSLNPEHLLKRFDRKSDLDVVIVSSSIFDEAWCELIDHATDPVFAQEEERRRFKKTKENFFQGYLRPDHLPRATSLAKEWFPQLSSRFSSQVAGRHEVKAWLFKSRRHASAFYAEHLGRVQANLKRLLTSRGDL
jgi:hypothetical protein